MSGQDPEEDKADEAKEEPKKPLDDEALEEAEIQKKLEAIMGREPKPWPGDDYKFDYTPDIIEFKWNKDMTNKRNTDTQHMLYVLQLALEKVRLRTNERNKYFKSINRPDRYISHLNPPEIITNFLDWHNLDKDKNVFDGVSVHKTSDLDLINEVIAKIGKVKLGPATKIVMKLKEIYIDRSWMELPQPKLQLKTVGYDRMYKGDKILAECIVAEVIVLLTFVNANADAEQKGNDDEKKEEVVNGIFARMEKDAAKKKKPSALFSEEDWKGKVIKYVEENKVSGKELMEKEVKQLTQDIMNAVVPITELNEKGKPRNNLLRGGVKAMLNTIKAANVNAILTAAKKQKK